MTFILIMGALLGGWAFLLLISGERLRRVTRISAQLAANEEERLRRQRESEKPIEVS